MGKLVSIIVPVYNASDYLENCIQSIVNQTYKDIELILIDDGSTDGSDAICERWKERDDRIVYCSQSQKGVSAARNLGLEKASGYYIAFVDSDDTIEEDAIESYVELTEQSGAELFISGYQTTGDWVTEKEYSDKAKEMNTDEAVFYILTPHCFHGSVWSKLYIHSMIRENGLKFDTDIRYCEDVLFNYEYLKRIKKAYYSPIKKYIYYVRRNSTMRQPVSSLDDKKIDVIKVFKRIAEESKEKPFYRLAVSRTVYASRIIPEFIQFKGGRKVIHTLRGDISGYVLTFAVDNVYPLKKRINTIVKILFPGPSYMVIRASRRKKPSL